MDNKKPSERYRKVKLVCVKDQALSSTEVPLEYNGDHMLLRI